MIDYAKIDYDQLALSMIKMQERVSNATFEEIKTPVAKISKETLEQFKKTSDEKVGLEATLREVMHMRASIEYRISALWDHIAIEVGFDRSEFEGNLRVDIKTGELFKTSTSYDEILNGLKQEKLYEAIKGNGGSTNV